MSEWWQRNIIEPRKLALLLCFAAFVVTFVTTRTITRLIRSGRGPFKNNVSSSGLHVHHAVPGLFLLVVGSVLAIGAPPGPPWREIAGVLIGIGASLVLDEFALILHLDDVYWSAEGRVSVEMVSLAVAAMGFVLVGSVPFGVNSVGDTELSFRTGVVSTTIINVALVVLAVIKGKYKMALVGAFVPVISAIAAVRLARPTSRWARRYDGAKLAKATERAARFDARWDPIGDRLADLVAGKMEGPPAT